MVRTASPVQPGPGAGPTGHRVVVVGGGFGGLQAALKLAEVPVEVTLIDRRNFHLFTPLLYQVATGTLSPGEIATPLRTIFKRQRNVRVLLGEVTGFDIDGRQVVLAPVNDGTPEVAVPYDTLIVAAGSEYAYFGHDEWRPHAPAVKTLDSALEVRRRLLGAFEAAEVEAGPEHRAAWLTFVVIGGGPTGVELAGQFAELARETLRGDFRAIDPGEGRIFLVEYQDRVLTTFPSSLSAKATRALAQLGVTSLLGQRVVEVDGEGVVVETADGASERIGARTVVWAAGVAGSPLAAALAEETGADLDRSGRITVEPDLTLPGHAEILALGDMVRVRGHDPYMGVSPVAMQQGRHAARVVHARLRGRRARPFRYLDKGNVATIGRARAVVDLRGFPLSGFPAWVFWLALHLYYLIGFQNRLLIVIRWAFSYITRGRGARLITGEDEPRAGRSRGLLAQGADRHAVDPCESPSSFWNRRYEAVERLWSAEPNALLAEFAEKLSPGRALDVGAGEGRNAVWLVKRGWRVTALDVSGVALARAAARAAEEGVDLECVEADWREHLPHPSTYELVVISFIHPHPDERTAMFEWALDALAAGGHLFVVGVDLADGERRGPPDPERLYTPERLREGLRGFELLRCESVAYEADSGQSRRAVVDVVAIARRPTR
jgi:NADH:ubiquinone reductase (H+-translocating)